MENLDTKYFYKWFDEYSKNFYCGDEFINENIKLKREHTKRVCDNANMISNALNLCKKDKDIAEIAALFHDIGRFKQFKKYQTFNDKISENHALLGVKVLNENGILVDLEPKIQEYILKSVEYHNMYKMPEIKDEKLITFAKIIRDSDKIDIFKVVTDYYKLPEAEKNPAVELNLKDTPGFSKKIIEDIYNFKNSSNTYIKNRNDIRLIKISWLFDINFNVSLKAIFERGNIEESFNALPQTEELIEVKEKVMKYISNRIKAN